MVISQKKSINDILKFLQDKTKIIIVGCSECATLCQVGGEKEILEMKDILESEGKEISATIILSPACHFLNTRKDMRKLAKDLEQADAILSLTCGDGTQTIAQVVDLPVYPGTDTMFIGEIQRFGQYEEACRACGQCELGWTAGICPITRCAKGLINGPCGGSKNGKCEVNLENDCAWIMIYEKLREMGKLEEMTKIRQAKDYQKSNNPRIINLKREKREKVKS